MFPSCGSVYTLAFIVTDLNLRDTPSLNFVYEGRGACIQTSHCLLEDLLTVPGWSDIRFTFHLETNEWIPVFNVVTDDNDKLLTLLDVEPTVISAEGDILPGSFWAVPKAFPREQYYASYSKLHTQGTVNSLVEARAKAHAEYVAQYKDAHNLHTPDFEVWLKANYPKLSKSQGKNHW